MTSYIAACLFLLITPGPGVLTTAGAGAAFGFRGGLAYALGVVAGSPHRHGGCCQRTGSDHPGLSAGSHRSAWVFRGLSVVPRVADRDFGHPDCNHRRRTSALGLFNGIALSVINPKAYAVMTTLFSGFAFYPPSTLIEGVIKAVVFTSISVPVHLAWLGAGATIRRLALGARLTRAVNIAMAVAMLAVVALAVLV